MNNMWQYYFLNTWQVDRLFLTLCILQFFCQKFTLALMNKMYLEHFSARAPICFGDKENDHRFVQILTHFKTAFLNLHDISMDPGIILGWIQLEDRDAFFVKFVQNNNPCLLNIRVKLLFKSLILCYRWIAVHYKEQGI